MKIIIALLVVLMTACTVFGGTFRFTWTENVEQVDGYRLFTAVESGGPYIEPVQEVGNVATLTTVEMIPGNHCFVLRAFRGDLESGNSDEVCGVMPLNAPLGFRIFIN